MNATRYATALLVSLAMPGCLVPGALKDDALDEKLVDLDLDGQYASPWGDDCDDLNPHVYLGAPEICDGLDNDCDGNNTIINDIDADGDGWLACDVEDDFSPGEGFHGGSDCDDENDSIHPGADEVCDNQDNNCNDEIDEPTAIDVLQWYTDADGDGYGDAATEVDSCDEPANTIADGSDCDDADSTIHPGALEICDGQRNDCGTALSPSEIDDDADGFVECTLDANGWDGELTTGFLEMLGDDCDDTDATIHPLTQWYPDTDSDGYGDSLSSDPTIQCANPGNSIHNNADCNDQDAGVHPAATEVCDGVDNNCDGTTDGTDSADAIDWFDDTDADGFGDPAALNSHACTAPDQTTADSTDCNDSEDTVYPGAAEICDGLDNDCDGLPAAEELDDDQDGYVECILDSDGWDGLLTPTFSEMLGRDCDDADSSILDGVDYYTDDDGDGYGLSSEVSRLCSMDPGYAALDGDCLDTDSTVYPTAAELCDGQDNDCDGTIPTNEVDGDNDGWVTCTIDSGGWDYQAISGGGDCNDTAASIYPTATEACDGADNDCDGVVPPDEVDDDLDNWVECSWSATSTTPWLGPTPPDGGNDCNDAEIGINPGEDERCADPTDATIDYNCDGDNEAGTTDGLVYYQDADLDHFGNPAASQTFCTAPSGWNADNTDCDDTSASINPNEVEICFDGLDNDCDGATDDSTAVDAATWYEDSDGDGYGANDSFEQQACEQPVGYVSNDDDCVDSTANIYPGAAEIDDTNLCMQDEDGDGYGNLYASGDFPNASGLSNGSDCDDTLDFIYVGAAWRLPSFCMEDADNDGYGAAVATGTPLKLGADCDDTHNRTHPWAASIESTDCMRDDDGDGWGSSSVSGDVSPGTDCNDGDPTIYPTATEVIDDQIDQDCDGADLESYFALHAGAFTTCGIKSNGDPQCWGRTDTSDSTDIVSTTPASGDYTEVAVSRMDEVACAVNWSTSLVDCWGYTGHLIEANLPTSEQLSGLSLGLDMACGIDTTTYEDITCWGGACPTTSCVPPPTAIWTDSSSQFPVYDGWRKLVVNSEYVGCAISAAHGILECWGDPNSQVYSLAPSVPTVNGILSNSHNNYIDIGMTDTVACAIYNNYFGQLATQGAIECWGDSNHSAHSPPQTTNWNEISCGHNYCCATNGLATECWGDTPTSLPTDEYSPLATGFEHLCGIDGDGLIECWGDNTYGQCDHP
ncbi:MAG: MopE-related protein [Myxococcota bacterium]|nr:MopE-related protein [Myxococcota bacterium]